jgi:hypothetical protein
MAMEGEEKMPEELVRGTPSSQEIATPPPFTASLTNDETLLQEKRVCKSLIFCALQTLENSNSCTSSICHS